MSVLDDALREQHARLVRRLEGGMPRAGWKICVNDRRMQKKLGLDSSFVGFLDGANAKESGGLWRLRDGALPGVEPEFALRLSRDVDSAAGVDQARAAIAGVAPALEVLDWQGAKFDLASLAASSSFHAGFVVGELRPLAAVPPIGPGCPRLHRGEEVLGVPDPSLVPADLGEIVLHVARCLAPFGEGLRRGDWLLGGACTNPARVEAGDLVEADFAGLGAVSLRFEA